MSDDLELDLDEELSSDFQEDVCDPTVDAQLLSVHLKGSPSAELGGVSFNFTAAAGVDVIAYNSPDDEDPAGVLRPASGDPAEDELAPQITFEPGSAWLKYRLTARLKGSAQAPLDSLGLEIEGEKEAVFSDYHVHPCGRETWKALVADSTNLRIASRLRHIVEFLGEREALAYQLRGRLRTAVSLSVADVFTTHLGNLSSLVRTDVPLDFKIESGLSIEASVSLSDDFQVVFSKASPKRFRVAVKKAKAKSEGVSGKLGVDVTFADPSQTETALTAALEGLIGFELEEVDAALDRLTLEDLPQPQRDAAQALVEELAERLGAEDVVEDLEELRQRWLAFRDRVRDKIGEIAGLRAAAAFTYEYQRIREDASILQAVLDEATLERFHGELLKGNIKNLVAWLRDNPSAAESYLHRKSVTRSRSWGFSLGFARWKISSRDRKKLECVERTDLVGRKKLSYLGVREYESRLDGKTLNWKIDFNAQMNDYAHVPPPREPRLDEFELGLALHWEWRERSLSKSELESFVDLGMIWGVLDEDDCAEVVDALRDVWGPGKAATVSVGLKLADPALRSVVRRAARGDLDALARSLGRAMPWWSGFAARTIIERRTKLYGELWKAYLVREDLQNSSRADLANFARQTLRASGTGHRIARQEGALGTRSDLTFAGQVELHRGVLRDWQDFADGLGVLRHGLESEHDHTEIPRAFEKMEEFWSQTLYVRALGDLLVGWAAGHPSEITRTFVVDVDGENQARIFVGSGQTA